jgi:hypothetical protein
MDDVRVFARFDVDRYSGPFILHDITSNDAVAFVVPAQAAEPSNA